MSRDVVVIGGGLIGLTIAWELCKRDLHVTVLERASAGSGASGAAAGMLAPLAEGARDAEAFELGLESLRLYPAMLDELRSESGIDVELRGPGLLRVATSEEETAELQRVKREHESRLGLELLTASEARQLEPELGEEVDSALLSPEERQLRPSLLLQSLVSASARRGIDIRENVEVTGFDAGVDSVSAALAGTERFEAATFVIAGGAWSRRLGEMLGAELPVLPVRGQIVVLQWEPERLRHVVYGPDCYVVPRNSGRVIVGSTEEPGTFDCRPTAQVVRRLLRHSEQLIPNLGTAAFEGARAGLRPGSADGRPVIARLATHRNVVVATGHFRNGVLLAPVTARRVAELIAG